MLRLEFKYIDIAQKISLCIVQTTAIRFYSRRNTSGLFLFFIRIVEFILFWCFLVLAATLSNVSYYFILIESLLSWIETMSGCNYFIIFSFSSFIFPRHLIFQWRISMVFFYSLYSMQWLFPINTLGIVEAAKVLSINFSYVWCYWLFSSFFTKIM